MENKLAILDRDGVINDNSRHYYIYRQEDFTFNPGALDAIAALCARGYRIAVVSNQSGIAKGMYTLGQIEKLHRWMAGEIARAGGHLGEDLIFVCPHHPSVSRCLCRKPEPLLLERAMARAGASRSSTIFIGDAATDVEAGMLAGVRAIKVEPNGDLNSQLQKLNII